MLILLGGCVSPHPEGHPGGAVEVIDSGSTSTPPPPDGTPGTGTSPLQFVGAPPANLLIVSLDTARRDHIGRYSGNGRTPNLDARMAEGVTLDEHRSCSSWTTPSMTCLVTGLTAFELGWWPMSHDAAVPGTDDDMPTLAGQLAYQKGYQTTLITTNDRFGSEYALNRGFQTTIDDDWQPAALVADDAIDAAQGLLDGGAPYYLHVHFVDPHANFCPPAEYIDQDAYQDLGIDLCDDYMGEATTYSYQSADWQTAFVADAQLLYDGEIQYWDAEFGRMWDALEGMGFLDDTLVVFVTDHGEQFFEHGASGHGNDLYAEENRATAMFWAKNLPAASWTGPTLHEDIGATLQTLFGVTPPTPSSGIPIGLAPADRTTRSMLYWGPGQMRLAVVRGGKQLTYDFWGEKHLWDHELDETGTLDSYDPSDPDVVALWVPMQAYVDEVLATWPSAGPATEPGP